MLVSKKTEIHRSLYVHMPRANKTLREEETNRFVGENYALGLVNAD